MVGIVSEEMQALIKNRDRWASRLQEATNVHNIILESMTKYTALVAELEDQIAALEAKEA